MFQCAKSVSEVLKSQLQHSSELNSDSILQLDTNIAEIHHNFNCIGCETNQAQYALHHGKIFNQMMVELSGDELQGSDKRLFISWNALGNGYMMNKMWTEGENCFNKSIVSAERLKTFKPTDVSFPYVNLGLAYWFTGRHEEAIITLTQGLRDREAEYGVDDHVSFM